MDGPQKAMVELLPLIEAVSPMRKKSFTRWKAICDISGNPVSKLAQMPSVYTNQVIQRLRTGVNLSAADLSAALERASKLFLEAEICGLSPSDYVAAVSSVTGLPEKVISNALEKIAEATARAPKYAKLGIPKGVPDLCVPELQIKGCAKQIRKGDVLSVIAPGNGPGVHSIWPQAIALGYRVVLRPSDREPYTAQRLINAMSEAGLDEYVAMLPTDHLGVDELVQSADLSIIYGGDALVERYEGRSDVLVQGPGRSKLVIGADYPKELALELVFESVVGLGGAACVCASSVLVEKDAPTFADEFYTYAKERLQDKNLRESYLPQLTEDRYMWWLEQVRDRKDVLVNQPEVFTDSSGEKRVMPIIMLANSALSPLVQLELPIAAVTFAPIENEDGFTSLANSLVVTVASDKSSLISKIEAIQSIRNLYLGQVPTNWMQPHVPHDAYISEFLMSTRGYCANYIN
ncbi:aldehyde dehydrogenase family protein [Vibrio sp. Of7-15]|uniref:aldehyde dehydrogenase family protein n=1 Tax=Vibrio sp. Of7-15 TaxID=2724879 RepID=UPI001EF18176|nr:aldehyde dehydrogenase family protein [Vibrio sp. Of7-15]MCG7500094.1 aldehyde dehydrogenase family protein [Vibrio sp. Of7-15]